MDVSLLYMILLKVLYLPNFYLFIRPQNSSTLTTHFRKPMVVILDVSFFFSKKCCVAQLIFSSPDHRPLVLSLCTSERQWWWPCWMCIILGGKKCCVAHFIYTFLFSHPLISAPSGLAAILKSCRP